MTMSDINYVIGDATYPQGGGPQVIVHCCNDLGLWGSGFVLALSKRWPEPESSYRVWHESGDPSFQLGYVQFIQVETNLWVANLIGQRGVRGRSSSPIRYYAIAEGLERVHDFAVVKKATVHMPRMGSGLAGGDWLLIEEIIKQNLTDKGIEVTVYDLPETVS